MTKDIGARIDAQSTLAVFALVVGCSGPRAASEPGLDEASVFDGHIDVVVHYARAGWRLDAYDLRTGQGGQTSLDRMRAGRVAAGFLTCGSTAEPGSGPLWPGLADCLAWAPRLAERHADRMAIVRSVDDIRANMRAGRIAFVLAIEGGDQIDGDLSRIPLLARAGVRSFGIVYDHHNELGDGAQAFTARAEPPRYGGLSELGARAVDALGAAGILVDVAHAADATAVAAARRSRGPVIASHTAARALVDTPRNISDEAIRAVAATDGVVMVAFVPYLVSAPYLRWWLDGERTWRELERAHPGDRPAVKAGMEAWDRANPEPGVTLADVADHIDHVARVAGKRHVGIGSDFDGISHVIPELSDHRGVPALLAILASRGWTADELRGLARDNVLRALAAAERLVAR